MSTTEYVLDLAVPREGEVDGYVWLEHERDRVRVRRVHPRDETVWIGEARELARQFVESHAELKQSTRSET